MVFFSTPFFVIVPLLNPFWSCPLTLAPFSFGGSYGLYGFSFLGQSPLFCFGPDFF